MAAANELREAKKLEWSKLPIEERRVKKAEWRAARKEAKKAKKVQKVGGRGGRNLAEAEDSIMSRVKNSINMYFNM